MGNQQAKVGLRLDREQYEAGGVITGRVYLSLPKQQPQSASNNNSNSNSNAIFGLHLRFTGEEYAQVARKQKQRNKNHRHHHEPVIERTTHVLVRNDFPLIDLRGTRAGQYEYPFELPVPPDLPGSMKCAKDKANKSYCEIRFHLRAYLVGGHSSGDVSAETTVRLLSRGILDTQLLSQPLLMEAESFPVNVCCFWNKGHIKLGWQTDKSIVAPGDTIQIDAFGENVSKLDVEALAVKWIETTTWKTGNGDNHRRSVQRIVAEQKIDVNRLSQWAPREVTAHGLVQNDNFQNHQPVHFSLHLPREIRETYSGAAVLVRHMIVVRVNTAGGFTTTSPESSCQVRVLRHANNVIASSSDPVIATATIVNNPPNHGPNHHPTNDDNTQNIVHAQALPSDWNPVQADVVVIPVAATVVFDEDTIPEATSYLATAPREEDLLYPPMGPNSAVTVPTYQATAPNESLLDSTTTYSSSLTGIANPPDATQQLRTCIVDSPENLAVLLTDPAWTDIVCRLDPREFCNLVSVAPTKMAGSIARTLASAMATNFTCRYVVACLWSLPDDTRMSVVCAVANLPNDLQTNKSTIEQELRGHELDQFRHSIAW